eukprot:s4945_g11.t1
MKSAGMKPGPLKSGLFPKALVWAPTVAKASITEHLALNSKKSLRCPVRHCAQELTRQGGNRVQRCSYNGEGRQLRREGTVPGKQHSGLHWAHSLQCVPCISPGSFAFGLSTGTR